MGTLTIDKKKFVVIEQKEFGELQSLAAKKTYLQKNFLYQQVESMPLN